MQPNLRYFYVPDFLSFVSEPDYNRRFEGEKCVEIKEGFKISDGRTIVDDRVKTPSQLLREGKYDSRRNVLLSSIFHNPLLFL